MVDGGTGVVALDHHVQHWMLSHQHPAAHRLADRLTTVISPPVDIVMLLLVGLARGRAALFRAVVAVLALGVVVLSMKYGLDRAAPDGSQPARGVFPSGHTASALICGGTAVVLSRSAGWRRRAWWALVAAVTGLVAVSLLYINAHWLSDVLGAVAVGMLVLWGLAVIPPAVIPPASAPRSPS